MTDIDLLERKHTSYRNYPRRPTSMENRVSAALRKAAGVNPPLSSEQVFYWLKLAKAAIREMREPHPSMIYHQSIQGGMFGKQLRDAWIKMILMASPPEDESP